MDIRLPDTTGLALTKIIKQKKPKTIIIAQTAYASQEEKHKAMEAGFDDFITKPLKHEALTTVIHRFFKHNPDACLQRV